MNEKAEKLGQVFTPDHIVDYMFSLRKNKTNILEPSVGDGAFFKKITNDSRSVGVEIDPTVAPKNALNIDFFDYSTDTKFGTCIGNPPYVAYKTISKDLQEKLKKQYPAFDNRTNLYVYFINKCFEHLKDNGELIFITPREFLKATCACELNEKMHQQGTFTHMIDLGDKMVFKGFSPNCVIFRYEKGNLTHKTQYGTDIDQDLEPRTQSVVSGQFNFTKGDYSIPLNGLFDVKVGAVSGCDEIFAVQNPKGNRAFVYSQTRFSGKTRIMHYWDEERHLNSQSFLRQHKERLINRKIKTFTEENWWHWGRGYHLSDQQRIYVNCKTRTKDPFFLHECNHYDGSVLALFLKHKGPARIKMLETLCSMLNKVDWADLGFMCGNRYVFSQKALSNASLPASFGNQLPHAIY